MENKLAVSQKKDNQSLELTHKQLEYCKALIHFNQLTPFIYSDLQISDWAKSIEEITPDVTAKTLKIIIDRMKTGYYPYDNKAGIQNIFKGISQYLYDEIDILKKGMVAYGSASVEDVEFINKPIQEKIDKLRVHLNKITKPSYSQYDGIL